MADQDQQRQRPPDLPAEKPLFTPKEEMILKLVWGCMKTFPEIDMDKLKERGGFNTMKTTSNTWGSIKKKIINMNMEGNVPATAGTAAAVDGDPATPKKPRTSSKKTTKVTPPKRDQDDSGEEGFRILGRGKKARRSIFEADPYDDHA